MTKIYLNASNQRDNPYSYGGTNEEAQMVRLAQEIHRQLQAYEVLSMVGTQYYIADKAREAKNWGADFSIALHSNAGTTTGSGAIAFYNKNYPVAKSLAEKMVRYVDEANPGEETHSKIVGDNSWLDVWNFGNLGIPSMLFEVTFHSNPEEARWIVEATADIARAIVRALVEQFNLKKRSEDVLEPVLPIPAPSVAKVLYRVQVGAYKEEPNAFKTAKKLEAAGFPIYPVTDGGFIKIQTGAFAEKPNAIKRENELKSLGFDTWITDKEGKPYIFSKNVTETVKALSVGNVVRIEAGKKSYTNQTMDSWVYGETFKIVELEGDRAVLGGIQTAFRVSDLIRV